MTRFAILATAGHIDHGKTALVRRLTGVDTDRLPEERARGISIDLGFASLPLPSGVVLGVVDVPGHERFIKNMLAGVGGIDLVLLVIAADEGVMPQTREHLDIVTLLGVSRGVVALTKRDLVDSDWLVLVEQDVRLALARTPLAAAPILPVSAVTGDGAPALVAALEEAARDLPARATQAPARLPVDRVFTVEGFGTVVTGTLWRGTLRVGDTIELLPAGRTARIRSLEVHGRTVPEAHAGQRTAVALHGVTRERAARGDWVVAPGSLRASTTLDARVRLLPGLDAPLKSGTRVRLYLGASEVLGRLVLLDHGTEGVGPRLAPGGTALAQFRLESPIVADRGDLFVIRSYSPLATIGGGTVIDPAPAPLKRRDADRTRRLSVAESGAPRDRVLEALRVAGATPAPPEALARAAGLDAAEARAIAAELAEAGEARAIGSGFVGAGALEAARERIVETLREYRRAYRLRWGMPKGELKSRLAREMAPALFDALLADVIVEGAVALRDDRLREGGAMELSIADERLRDSLLRALEESPYAPPAAGDLAARAAGEAGASTEDAAEMLAHLVFEGDVARISSEFAFRATALAEIERRVRERLAERPELVVGDFKDLLGVTRRHAVPLLEWLDRRGITSRRGDVRVAGKALMEARER